jgi:predicted HTH transcriptional regulator
MAHLLQKIAEGEHQQQDFKYQISDSRKIARTLSAFANTDGGRLLIGVKDNGKINGVSGMEEVHMVEGAADVYCEPAVQVDFQFHQIENKQVVEALVQPSSDRPHFVKEQGGKNMAYFRKNDENFLANRVLIKFWEKRKDESKPVSILENEKKLLIFLQQNPFITIKRFSRLTRLPFRKAEDLLATFISWGVIDWDYNGKYFTYFIPDSEEDDNLVKRY